MKMYGGVDVFLTSAALVGGEWSASLIGRFTPGERAPGTHWIGGWVCPRASLGAMEKRKIFTLPGLELLPLIVQPVASRFPSLVLGPVHFVLLFVALAFKGKIVTFYSLQFYMSFEILTAVTWM
jgi:hypothetical protein